MTFPRNWMALAVAALLPLAACDTTQEEVPPADEMGADAPMPAPEPAPPAPTTAEQTAMFEPLNESGISGQLVASAEGMQTRVQVMLAGAPSNATLQGHIHEGTCDAPGAVIMPLQSVETDDTGSGESTSTVDVDPATAFDGNHIVAYHEPGGDPGATVTCATLPRSN